MRKQRARVGIIGGGASGLMCGIALGETAKKNGIVPDILLFERMDRVGKKLLATGNGRCNLTHQQASVAYYDSSEPALVSPLLSQVSPQQILDFFAHYGLLCDTLEDGKVYPYSYQASTVLDLLREQHQRLNIMHRCGTTVLSIHPHQQGFLLHLPDQKTLFVDYVVLATGGKAMAKLGSNGSGYPLAQAFGHTLAPLSPALVAIQVSPPYQKILKSLKGVRANVQAYLEEHGKVIGTESGEIQFAEDALSGIVSMQLSRLVSASARSSIPSMQMRLDFFPHQTHQQLIDFLLTRQQYAPTLETLLLGCLHKKLGIVILHSFNLGSLAQPASILSKLQLDQLAHRLKGWCFPLSGTRSFSHAQVTQGGIKLSEVNLKTLTSIYHPRLSIVGELLDLTGLCGGFNLHIAWLSGLLAGQAIAKQLCND